MINRNNIEYELEEIVKSVQITDYEITVKVRAVAMDEHSDLSVSINDEVIHSGDIADGEHDLKRLVNVQPNKVIQLRAHTNTHRHGKRLEIIGLNVNGVDIFNTNLWVMDEQRFTHTRRPCRTAKQRTLPQRHLGTRPTNTVVAMVETRFRGKI